MKAQIEKNGEINEMDDDTVDNYNPRTKFYNSKDFKIYNFKNIIETPIPNYLDVKIEDESSVFFKFRDDLIEKKKNINQTGIGITVEPKKSNLIQDNFSTISDVELNSFLTINETMIKAMLPSWGLSDYELTNSSVTTKTSNFGVNYLETSFEFDNNGKKLITYLLLIPRNDDMIRLLTVFFLENEKDMLITMENLKLVDDGK